MTDETTLDDAALIAAAREGNRDAIADLVTRYPPQMFRFGTRVCGNPDDGADVAQETLLALARSIGQFRGDAELGDRWDEAAG